MPKGSPGVPRKSLAARLSNVEKVTECGCWIWMGKVQRRVDGSDGYGLVSIPCTRRQAYAHRAAWELRKGSIPDGLCVLHKCDVRSCVNPDHLFLGDRRDNARDAARKGRMLKKLTRDHVERIRTRMRVGASASEIAKEFGIARSLVWAIQTNRCHHMMR